MKIVSFTQTYGDERFELYDIHKRDTKLLELKDLCDVNIYSFHNVSVNNRRRLRNVLLLKKNVEYMYFDIPNYADTVRVWKERVKELGATHFLFMQDDTFSDDNEDIDWKELLDYVSFHKENFFLSLKYSPHDFVAELEPDMQFGTFGIHHLTVDYWMEHNLWAMDDQPFICSIDMIDKLYTEEYMSKYDIWHMEIQLRKIWEKKGDFPKFVTDRQLFQNYNILGMCTADHIHYRELLQDKKLVL